MTVLAAHPRSLGLLSLNGFSCSAKLHMGRTQCLCKVLNKAVEGPCGRIAACDQYIVGAGQP